MKNIYDIIVIGAGSIGLPTAYNLAKAGMKVLVLEAEHSPGQGNNKKAIGGVRATHSDFGKINVCLRSIEILKNWQEETGEDIGWLSNGYSYPAYNEKDAQELQDLMKIQHSFGLNIKWLSPDENRSWYFARGLAGFNLFSGRWFLFTITCFCCLF